jgi:hypothetical protein
MPHELGLVDLANLTIWQTMTLNVNVCFGSFQGEYPKHAIQCKISNCPRCCYMAAFQCPFVLSIQISMLYISTVSNLSTADSFNVHIFQLTFFTYMKGEDSCSTTLFVCRSQADYTLPAGLCLSFIFVLKYRILFLLYRFTLKQLHSKQKQLKHKLIEIWMHIT